MDRRFLEFWGNFFLQTARGLKQLEDLNGWMRRGFKGYEEYNSMFKQAFGLQDMSEDNPEYAKAWNRAAENFRNSLKESMELMGVVPRSEYLDLVKRYEDLKRKAASQEETIQHLNALLASKGAGEDQLSRGLQEIISKQSEQFQELMKSFNAYLQQNASGGGHEE